MSMGAVDPPYDSLVCASTQFEALSALNIILLVGPGTCWLPVTAPTHVDYNARTPLIWAVSWPVHLLPGGTLTFKYNTPSRSECFS